MIIIPLKFRLNKKHLCYYLIENFRRYFFISKNRKWISKGKPIANNFNDDHADLILVEHLNNFEVYGTLRLKYHLLKKLNVNFNHKKILRYKNILNLKTITRKKKSISRRIQLKRRTITKDRKAI